MKQPAGILPFIVVALAILTTGSEALAKKPKLPETTHDGLVLVEKSKNDVVYLLPDVDMSPYNKIMLMEPHMAFHKDWQRWYNSSANMMDRISDRDMEKMLKRAKELFMSTFTKTLKNKGYPVVEEPGEDVLLIHPEVINIEVSVPDPDRRKGMGRGGVYSEYAGSMTFIMEAHDSVSGQILVRTVDTERDIDQGWRIPRDYTSNERAARMTFDMWAKRIANGLDKMKKAKTE
jgi:hypothetical protein